MRRSLFWLLDHHPETGESLASVHATALAHARLADRLNAPWYAVYVKTPGEEPERLSVAEAFGRHAGIDLMATLDENGNGRRDALARQEIRRGLSPGMYSRRP